MGLGIGFFIALAVFGLLIWLVFVSGLFLVLAGLREVLFKALPPLRRVPSLAWTIASLVLVFGGSFAASYKHRNEKRLFALGEEQVISVCKAFSKPFLHKPMKARYVGVSIAGFKATDSAARTLFNRGEGIGPFQRSTLYSGPLNQYSEAIQIDPSLGGGAAYTRNILTAGKELEIKLELMKDPKRIQLASLPIGLARNQFDRVMVASVRHYQLSELSSKSVLAERYFLSLKHMNSPVAKDCEPHQGIGDQIETTQLKVFANSLAL